LNREPPNIYLKAKKAGGMKINFQATPKSLDEKMVYNILRDYKMLNCEVLIRDDTGKYFKVIRLLEFSAECMAQQPSTT
jgi:ribosome-interacting GTPase 1